MVSENYGHVEMRMLIAPKLGEPTAREASDSFIAQIVDKASGLHTHGALAPFTRSATASASYMVGRSCSGMPAVADGTLVSPCWSARPGGKCEFECRKGFKPVGELICVDGKWTQPACEPKGCDEAPVIRNAEPMSQCQGAPSGSICQLQCHGGFVASADVICVLGEWTKPRCREAPCTQMPVVAHSASLSACAGMRSGGVCSPRCDTGYLPSDEAITCSRGQWQYNAAPRCGPAPCLAVPVVENSGDLASCVPLASGEVCAAFRCAPGYEAVGTLACNFGQWSHPVCHPERCSDAPSGPAVHPARYCIGTPSGGRCWPRCPDGQKPTGPFVCDRGEFLSDGVMCINTAMEVSGCEVLPAIPGAEPKNCDHVKSGGECPIHCKKGWQQLGGSGAVCVEGRFSPVRCLSPQCNVEVARDHAADMSACIGSAGDGPCAVLCEPGYRLSRMTKPLLSTRGKPAPALFCNEVGRFEGPVCDEARCDSTPAALSLVAADDIAGCVGMENGQSCEFECSAGFSRTGALTCLRGEWQTGDVACVPSRCEEPPEIPNAADLAHCAGVDSGGSCPLPCKGKRQASADLFCSNGKWLEATCDLYCPEVVIPGSEELPDCTGLLPGDFCTLQCRPGLQKSGDLLCLEGEWNVASCTDRGVPLSGGVTETVQFDGLIARDGLERWWLGGLLQGVFASLLRLDPGTVAVLVDEPASATPRGVEVGAGAGIPDTVRKPGPSMDVPEGDRAVVAVTAPSRTSPAPRWEPVSPPSSWGPPQRRAQASITRVSLSIACAVCKDVKKRVEYTFSQRELVQRRVRDAVCKDRCSFYQRRADRQKNCTLTCPENEMQILYFDSPIIHASPL